jgi:hypothetical protein
LTQQFALKEHSGAYEIKHTIFSTNGFFAGINSLSIFQENRSNTEVKQLQINSSRSMKN